MRAAAALEILLVEDDPDHAEITRRALLQEGGHKVTWVKDGQEALDFLATGARIGLIVLDIGLPRIGGHDVLKAVKRDDRLRDIPVIMLTTSRDPDDIARCYDLGANSYVLKALDLTDFMGRVKAITAYWLTTNTFPEAFAVASA